MKGQPRGTSCRIAAVEQLQSRAKMQICRAKLIKSCRFETGRDSFTCSRTGSTAQRRRAGSGGKTGVAPTTSSSTSSFNCQNYKRSSS